MKIASIKLMLNLLFMCLAMTLFWSNSANGHHSHGNYQVQTLIEIQGVVTDVHMSNPHVWIFMDVEDEAGEVANWAIEGGSVASFKRTGWGEIHTGDNLTMNCSPTRVDNNGCLVKDIKVNSSNGEGEASSWVHMTFQDDFFQANFPQKPVIRQDTYKTEYGATLPSTIYQAKDGDSTFSVTVVDFSDIRAVHEAQADLVTVAGAHNFWWFDQLAAISYAARQYRLRGGDVVYDAWHVIDGIEGHQISLTNQDGTLTSAGIYRNESRLYILEANVPEGSPPQGIFQQSLNIIDTDGQRIRYRLNPDHTKERVEIE